jgi:chemotaxis regulatin CheY-phosphate phosphatase CheZ
MHECPEHGWTTLDADLVAIPSRARDEIGHLASFLERVRANLLQVNVHVQGSSRTVPRVLNELKDIVQMTEAATLRVLEETEALLEEGQTLSGLVAQAQQAVADGALPEVSRPLSDVQGLVDRGNDRVMAIMSALEFQDLTTQKIQRAFEVLEEVASRLGKIHQLVSLGQETAAEGPAVVSPEPPRRDAKSGQDLADEILSRFRG